MTRRKAAQQAARYFNRRRRLSRVAIPALHQTRFVPIGGPFPDAVDVVQDPSAPVTFKARVICTGVPNGALLTIGSSSTGLFFVSGKLEARVNGGGVQSVFTFADGVRFDVALAIVPGTGRFRCYIESQEQINGQVAAGDYVSAGNLTLSAPSNVLLDDGLRVYALHVPQGLVGSTGTAPPGAGFDDILFRATAHLLGGDQFTPPHFPSYP